MKNQVQLITYVDRLGGGNLPALERLLSGSLKGLFGGVHLLPFFNAIDGADAGFDPKDHTQVDPRLGDWRDIKSLSTQMEVMADVIVNHMSSESPQFLDYLSKGPASEYNGLFLTPEAVFPNGMSDDDVARIYRPRPGLPFTEVKLGNGETRKLWTTFTPQQIDIDVHHVQGVRYLDKILSTLGDSGVTMVRLDAVGYAIKRAGESCFMMPETFEFIADFTRRAKEHGLEVLVEIHSYYRKQIEIAACVDWVYDFALPPLVLHAFTFGTARYLQQWIDVRPANALTVLDTHDGIGIIDIGADRKDGVYKPGLVPPAELDQLVEAIHRNSQGGSRLATGAAASNLDLYQVNCTFFDAMGRDEVAYVLARAVQFFLPGIPQVYYVGLLAGGNDLELLNRTAVGRDINRHYYQPGEVDAELQRPVVKELCELIRLRNWHPAFNGRFSSRLVSDELLTLRWDLGREFIELTVDFQNVGGDLRWSAGGAEQRHRFSGAEWQHQRGAQGWQPWAIFRV